MVDRLVRLGHQVIVLDDLSTGNLERLNPSAEPLYGSVADVDAVVSATEGAEVVFHTAAWARIERSIADPVGTHQVNVTGTLNVLRAAQVNGVSRMINSSSSSVYGDQPTHLMREDMAPNPKSPYALQKLMGEQYADLFARLFGMSVVSLRYFNVYGHGQPSQGAYSLVIPRFLRMREEGNPLTVYGDGTQTRSYTHVSDVVEANILAATAELPAGEHTVLNIGTGQETSVNDIAAAIGGPVQHIVPNPRREFEEARKAADYSIAQSLIGWEPRVAFADGIKDLLE
ncbi:Putative UDP-glucose 4-epimerase [Geodia barretti]|uniref:UDP-glucose 4-epimerase n=1 Tax=Geodia barretti TaxID=519541 RepID=A0AA35T435_GEOBA|nr:Putative UDP-glucose 4-epimerase [Geodia barretti]